MNLMGSFANLLIIFISLISFRNVLSFSVLESTVSSRNSPHHSNLKMSFSPCELNGHPSALPGDPSLILVTNIDLGDNKVEFMKACSKAICKTTGKPEAYVGKIHVFLYSCERSIPTGVTHYFPVYVR